MGQLADDCHAFLLCSCGLRESVRALPLSLDSYTTPPIIGSLKLGRPVSTRPAKRASVSEPSVFTVKSLPTVALFQIEHDRFLVPGSDRSGYSGRLVGVILHRDRERTLALITEVHLHIAGQQRTSSLIGSMHL
jgi:hypothetical protein